MLDKLKKENTELKQKKICVICGNKDIEFVSQPCSHLTCDACSELAFYICKHHLEWNSVVACSKQSVIQIHYCFHLEKWLNKMYYIVGITPAVSAGQKATPSIRTDNDPNWDTRSTYPITVSSASESSTVGFSTCRTKNNMSASTGGHELLVARSPQEQHDHNQQGSSIILCHIFSPNIKIHWIKRIMSQVCMRFIYLKILNSKWFGFFGYCKFQLRYYIIKEPFLKVALSTTILTFLNDHLVALISLVACRNVRPFLDFKRGYQKLVLFICQILSILIHANSIRDICLRCLTPLSTIFQLYCSISLDI